MGLMTSSGGLRALASGLRLRKALLTLHVISSVGVFGAIGSFFLLAITGLLSKLPGSSVYPAMDLIARFVILPSALTALASGLAQALCTRWGLTRRYWVTVN